MGNNQAMCTRMGCDASKWYRKPIFPAGSESDECQLVNLEHFCRSMPTSPSGLKNFRNVVTCDPIFSYREYRTKRKQSEPVGKTGNGALNKVKINGPATEP